MFAALVLASIGLSAFYISSSSSNYRYGETIAYAEDRRTSNVLLQKKKESKLILFFNPSTTLRGRNITNVVNPNYFTKCPVSDCVITLNREDANISDAVIFEWQKMPYYPNYTRPSHQIWIFYQLEAHSLYGFSRFPGFFSGMKNNFNWTMTYSKQSDIYLPYGLLRHKPKGTIWKRDYLQIAASKSKDAIWIASHCLTNSKREEYAKLLKQYIDVTILGKCGRKWNCGRRHYHEIDDCFSILNSTYRYYLAFENAFCEDYVTEKFFENYKYDIVQVVRAETPTSRSINISNQAYINSRDFKTYHELGKYLQTLSLDNERYAAMLAKKDEYENVAYMDLLQNSMCEVCLRLHNLDKFSFVYKDTYEWMRTREPCVPPRDMPDITF